MALLALVALLGAGALPVFEAFADSAKPAAIHCGAKRAKQYAVPKARQYLVPVAQLMRVDEGVFELEIGKTIDLTDRKILLAIKYDSRRRCCRITLNGRRENYEIGTRIDLKQERNTKSFVADKEVCFLDVVDIADPKGAPGIATFRLHCL